MAASVVLSPRAFVFRYQRGGSSSPSTTTSSTSDSPTSVTVVRFAMDYMHESPISPTTSVAPKVEELDEEQSDSESRGDHKDPEDTEQEPETPTSATIARRPRGRPRKYPPLPIRTLERPPKGRSKTGCLTCRRRKKKCDETKPHCLHCQKNNVVCEGYQPKDYWRPGRPTKSRQGSETPKPLPQLIAGVENDIDRFFLDHFHRHVSRVLSLFTDRQNPFKELLLPMALNHKGLMHSLLCLSGTHLVRTNSKPDFVERQLWHFQQSIAAVRNDQIFEKARLGDTTAIVDDATVAQTLALCLNSICAGDTQGESLFHLDATNHLLQRQRSRSQDFQTFLEEFSIYHTVSNNITSLREPKHFFLMDNFQLPHFVIQPEEGMFLGVVDGLFGCLSRIRQLRDKVRRRRSSGQRPLVDYEMIIEAGEIDKLLRAWQCEQPVDTPRWAASMLYRQCTWLYLHRTIKPSAPNSELSAGVEEALEYLSELPADSSAQSLLLMPLFVLGCATFDPKHRPTIREALDTLEAYSHFGNIKNTRLVVERVWELMDAGDDRSWDWETVMSEKGWDFLVT